MSVFRNAFTLVRKKTYRMKVAPMARPRAFIDPIVCFWFTNTSFAICVKDDFDDILAVFAIILKKTISKGVRTRATAADEARDAISKFIKRLFEPLYSTLVSDSVRLSVLR